MYTELKSYQIIIALLKKFGIRRCVLSAGSRNVPFVHSVEEDSYFICYSVVDERSAGYFALGLSQECREPVVISCTASTASCNYYPPVAEAYYQHVPLVVLTSDRDPMMLHQWEDQMIDQVGMYDRHVVKSVNLPIVHNEHDELWCQRLINEAFLELSHHDGGPVHINIPMVSYNMSFTQKGLPPVRKITRIGHESPTVQWDTYIEKLKSARRILITAGQMSYVGEELKSAISFFFQKYNCAVSVDCMSNMDVDFAVNTSLCWDTRNISKERFEEFLPDIVISFGGNIFQGVKELLKREYGKFDHWLIQEDGCVVDLYNSLTTVFECSPAFFFSYFAKKNPENQNDRLYHNEIKEFADSVRLPEISYSNVYAIRNVVERIPSGSILHLTINGAIRITNYCRLNPGITVYANIGTYGIDGGLSSFLGQASSGNRLSYLVAGDLAFFYDMNAMRIKHIHNNVRILLINNHGGEEFYYNGTYQNESSDQHTTARHNTKAEGWARETGFLYLTANDREGFDAALEKFMVKDSDKPIFFEVFTEMSTDAKILSEYYALNRSASDRMRQKSKNLIKSIIGSKGTQAVKKILGK